MNASLIVAKLEGHKGQQVTVTWEREAATLKDCPLTITKRTIAAVRAGIAYANLRTVREGIANGTRGEVQEIKWAEWIQHPFILRHKAKLTEYVRLYKPVLNNTHAPRVEWFIGGQPATYENVEPYLLAKEKRGADREEVDCFTVKASDILAIE